MDARMILIVALAILAALILVPALAMMVMMGGGMMGMGGMMSQPGPMMGSGWLTLLSWTLVVVGVALLLVWGIRGRGGRATRGDEEAPLTILQRRYARGEIGHEEYERIRADLLRDRGEG